MNQSIGQQIPSFSVTKPKNNLIARLPDICFE